MAGTHTHVPTADERILPGGTAYVTDLGMWINGRHLGMQREPIINKFLTQLPARFAVAKGNRQLCGVITDIDITGKAQKIVRIYYEKKLCKRGILAWRLNIYIYAELTESNEIAKGRSLTHGSIKVSANPAQIQLQELWQEFCVSAVERRFNQLAQVR